jgi:F-type H+-transporting ATPase subunit gamma
MGLNQKAIKTRIKSVQNTKKITKAMEMVSAAKMRRAVDATLATREYADLARGLLRHLSNIDDPDFPLLEDRDVKNILVVFVSSNRGLCGGYNSAIAKTTKNALIELVDTGTKVSVVGIGRRSVGFAKKNGYDLPVVYDAITDNPSLDQVLPIANFCIEEFERGTYDRVFVAYTDYRSSIVQEPRIAQILPISRISFDDMDRKLGANEDSMEHQIESVAIEEYIFEPDLETVVREVLPRLVEVQLYQSILESSASEHSARMVAMKSASDAAGDMIDELKLSSNKARQAAITQEIAEIAGGAVALSG